MFLEPRRRTCLLYTSDAADEALSLLRQAEQALADGDLGRYQELVETALTVLSDAADNEANGDNADEDASAEDTDAEEDGDG